MKNVYLILAHFLRLYHEEGKQNPSWEDDFTFPSTFPCAKQPFPMPGLTKHEKTIDFPSPSLIFHEQNPFGLANVEWSAMCPIC